MKTHDADKSIRDRVAEYLSQNRRRTIAGAFTHKMRHDLRIQPGDNLEPVADAIDEVGVSLIDTMEKSVIVAVKHEVTAIVDRKIDIMIYTFAMIEAFQAFIIISIMVMGYIK